MKMVHLVQHTHWDREWYFTENDSKAVLYYFMHDLLNRLEQDETLGPFVLDGQTVVLEDYYQIAPEQRARVEALIRTGRILIGPWYTQTDFLVVGAESITRNLLLGEMDCQQWGSRMTVGYVPDSFGQTAQLPMFLRQFGIHEAVIWRGWCEHDVANSEFLWRSDDGSVVTTAVMPWGYGCAKWLSHDVEKAQQSLVSIIEKQAQFSLTELVLLPNGNDQSPFEYKVPSVLAQLNSQQQDYHFVRSSFSQFFSALSESGASLPVWQGELLSPKYMRIHRGIFSTRMDIKLLNARLEQFVSQMLEPLLSLNWRLGLPYPQQAVDHIWREAMKSHAHDSIGGCNSDRVNSMVKDRLLSGMEMADQLFDLNMKLLAEGIRAQQQGKKIIVFNSLPHVRDAQVRLTLYTPEADFCILDGESQPCRWQLLHDTRQDMSNIVQELANSTATTWYRHCELLLEVTSMPACGYRTFYLQEGLGAGFESEEREVESLENPWLKLTFEQGVLTLTDKRSQQRYPGVLRLVDGGDAGDNYNYSPPEDDWRVSSDGQLQLVRCTRSHLTDSMLLTCAMAAPRNLASRNQHRLDACLEVEMTLTLPRDQPWLDVEMALDNSLSDHRLQIEIPIGVDNADHFADQPFGLIRRDDQAAAMALWVQEQWTEAPASLYPMQSLVMKHHGDRGICLVTEGLREYEIPSQQSGVLALTLLRSVGWLGQADMPWRPGRASGMVLPSPDSQLPGPHRFHFALLPMAEGQSPAFWRDVEQWRVPMTSYLASDWSRFKTNPHDQCFPPDYSLLSWDSELHFSTLKKAQKGDALVLRGWNPGTHELPHHIPDAFGKVTEVTLAEQSVVSRTTAVVPPGAPVSWIIE